MSYGFVVWWPGMENAECVSTLLEDNKTLSKSRFEKTYAKIEGVFADGSTSVGTGFFFALHWERKTNKSNPHTL